MNGPSDAARRVTRSSRAQFGEYIRFRGEAANIAATALLLASILSGSALIVVAAGIGSALERLALGPRPAGPPEPAALAGDARRALSVR